jgi:hypothetical protein
MGAAEELPAFARWRFDPRRPPRKNKIPAATLFRRTAEPPLSRGARAVQGLSQVVDHSLKASPRPRPPSDPASPVRVIVNRDLMLFPYVG